MKKLTKAYIAEKAGVSAAFMTQITKGLKRPSWPTSKKLAHATDTDPVLWLEGSPEEIQQVFSRDRTAA